MNASAVSDAQRNAEINGISNCKFICAKVRSIVCTISMISSNVDWH